MFLLALHESERRNPGLVLDLLDRAADVTLVELLGSLTGLLSDTLFELSSGLRGTTTDLMVILLERTSCWLDERFSTSTHIELSDSSWVHRFEFKYLMSILSSFEHSFRHHPAEL